MKDSYNEISKQASGHPQLEEEEEETQVVPRSASKKHTEAQVEKHLKSINLSSYYTWNVISCSS